MRTKVIVLVVLGALMLSAGAAFAQGTYGGYGAPGEEQKPYLRAKIGWFEPSESDLDGNIAFGVDYIVPHEMEHLLYLSVDRLHAEDTSVESTTWSLMAGAYIKTPPRFYYGAGIGIARETLEITGLPDRDETNFAWEISGGMMVGRTGFVEVKYRDGGEDGNRGPIIWAGVGY